MGSDVSWVEHRLVPQLIGGTLGDYSGRRLEARPLSWVMAIWPSVVLWSLTHLNGLYRVASRVPLN